MAPCAHSSSTRWVALAWLLAASTLAPSVLADASADASTQARALVVKARIEFDAGRYEASAELLEEASHLVDSSAVLYNLAWSYQRAGAREKAVDAYERYLRKEPNANDAETVRRTLAQLRAEIADREALAAAAEKERARADAEAAARRQVEADRSRIVGAVRGPSPIPWIGLGVGLGGVVAGTIFGVLSSAAHQDAVGNPDAMLAAAKQDAARNLALGANVCFVAGSVLSAVGLVWGIVDLRAAAARRHDVEMKLGLGAVSVAVTF